MFCPTYMQQLCNLKKGFTINPACTAVVEKPSCGSELVFLDLYPESLQPNQVKRRIFFAAKHQQRGMCSSQEEQVNVSAVPVEASQASLQPHPDIRPRSHKATVTCARMCNIYLNKSIVHSALHLKYFI